MKGCACFAPATYPSAGAACLSVREGRVVLVVVPSGGIGQDVFADGNQFGLIPDDVFVIIALPHGRAGRGARKIDVSGGGRFERPDDGGNGTDRRFSELFGRRGTACRAPTIY